MNTFKYNIGYALSGGFIKGFAHLGIMQALHEHGITPNILSGVSAGLQPLGYFTTFPIHFDFLISYIFIHQTFWHIFHCFHDKFIYTLICIIFSDNDFSHLYHSLSQVP